MMSPSLSPAELASPAGDEPPDGVPLASEETGEPPDDCGAPSRERIRRNVLAFGSGAVEEAVG